jgi:predicted O-linked N-acetylglucosamine transferase (SPINDLY family)
LGFLSSDLRHHVVAFFVQPLFEFLDPRFQLYIYSSYPGAPDVVQPWFEGRAAAVRKLPADDSDAAAIIADDNLDLLIDLGGPTSFNRPGLLAYRPARQQASWLGYPHSMGFSTIDYMIVDPRLRPARPDLLIERPLELPHSWVCLAPAAFQARPEPAPGPTERAGVITFGTANDPYKYTPHVLRTWARVVAAVPGARFMIIRPEAGAPAFQDNIADFFAEQGVARDRLDFRPSRGAIRPFYAGIDIALDTFPVTGGTTTCDALWMGVPTVTLVGEALHERLSWSLLSGLGLADLGATTVEGYVAAAVALAGDRARLRDLRRNLRDDILAAPLGQPRRFAADFYDLMARTVAEKREAAVQP